MHGRTAVTPLIRKRRDALLAAWRSGEYAQTQGMLKNNQGFCCLGVAEDVRGAVFTKPAHDPGDHVVEDYFIIELEPSSSSFESAILTDAAVEYYGFDGPNPCVYFEHEGNQCSAAMTGLNDNFKFGFDRIADIMEAQEWW